MKYRAEFSRGVTLVFGIFYVFLVAHKRYKILNPNTNISHCFTVDDMAIQTDNNNSGPPLMEFRSNEMRTFSTQTARPGLYILQVSPLERETYVKLYASLEPGGPHPLRLSQRPRLRLQKRQRRKRLTVRWEPR
jgi:hypothetical protein